MLLAKIYILQVIFVRVYCLNDSAQNNGSIKHFTSNLVLENHYEIKISQSLENLRHKIIEKSEHFDNINDFECIKSIKVESCKSDLMTNLVEIELSDTFDPVTCEDLSSQYFYLKISQDHLEVAYIYLKYLKFHKKVNSLSIFPVYFDDFSSRKLQTCGNRQYYFSGFCMNCLAYCLECSDGLTCNRCYPGRYFDQTTGSCSGSCNGDCYECSKTASNCTACFGNQFLSNFLCSSCNSACKTCVNSSTCTQCNDGYYKDGVSQTCFSCNIQKCKTCLNQSVCLEYFQGYFFNNITNSYSQCIQNCDSCSSTLTCDICSQGYYPNALSSSCLGCGKNIATCDQKGKCLTCISGFYCNLTNGYCFACPYHCDVCSNDGACTSCSRYYYPIDPYTCGPCPDQCQICFKANTCFQCDNGYYIDPVTSLCISCMPNCNSCLSAHDCSSCNGAWYFDESSSSCVHCPSLCNSCLNSTYCTSCYWCFHPGCFMNSNHLCEFCSPNCNSCTSINQCQYCYEGNYLFNGSCYSCPNTCNQCISETNCTLCNDHYYLGANNSCTQSCIPHCKTCTNSSDCSNCDDFFFFNGSSCVQCPFNCRCCDQNICTSCSAPWNFVGDQCLRCPYPITQCVNNNKPNDGFYIKNNEIGKCGRNCKSCDYEGCNNCISGYYSDPYGVCQSCPSGCISCLDKSSCKSCSSYFFQTSNGTCEPFPLNCNSVDGSNFCIQCNQSFFLTSNKLCSACPENCVLCNNGNVCNTCANGFYMDTQGLCEKCLKSCGTCSNNFTCTSCLTGFYLLNNNCYEMPPNCMSFSGNCTQCRQGTYLKDGLCYICPIQDCTNCDQYGCYSVCDYGTYFDIDSGQCLYCDYSCALCNKTGCITCYDGFYSTPSLNICLEKCNSFCEDCDYDTKNCTACIQGYYLNLDIFGCEPCPNNCSKCNKNNCLECNSQYALNKTDQQCYLYCNNECSQCNNSYCYQCVDGFYLDSFRCLPCNNSCLTCTSEKNCTSCPTGFVFNNQSQCVSNTCHPNCTICDNSKCFSCNPGYFVQNYTCVKCPTHCVKCSTNNTCDTCDSLSVLNRTDKLCYNYCDSSCNNCSVYNCTSCNSGYYLNAFQCLPCKSPCLTCSNQTYCLSCTENYSLNPSSVCVYNKNTNNCKIVQGSVCKQCENNYFLYIGLCYPCSSNCVTCSNAQTCTVCSTGYVLNQKSACVLNQCDNFCQICTYGLCSTCKTGYYLNGLSCNACAKFCSSCNNTSTCVCIQNYILNPNNVCVPCDNPQIIQSYFSEDFSKITVVFSSVFTVQNISGCYFLSSNDSFGVGFSCKIGSNSIDLVFGNNFLFSNTSVLVINLQKLYANLCIPTSQYFQNITAQYTIIPTPISGSINGVSMQSIGCNSSFLTYSADKVNGVYGSMNFSWGASLSPNNIQVQNFINQQNSSTFDLPLYLLNHLNTNLNLKLTLSNSLKGVFVTTINTVFTNSMVLSVSTDCGLNASIKASQPNYVIAQVVDYCGVTCRPIFDWVYLGSNNQKFNDTAFLKIPSSNTLTIGKSTLPPGFTYNFLVSASCSDIRGNTSVAFMVQQSQLIVVLDRADSTISNGYDLIVDGSQSSDPDKVSVLTFSWTCSRSDGQQCTSFANNLPSFTVPSASLVGGTSLVITLTVSAGSRTASKSVTFTVIQNLNIFININFHNTKIEPSFTTLIPAQVYSNTAVSMQWAQIQGPFLTMYTIKLPTLIFLPNMLQRGTTYQFMISANANSQNSASASVSFITNIAPTCFSSLVVSPSNGTVLMTLFEFSINLCSDPDSDLPITYTFGVITNDNKITISLGKQFSSISTKLFQGDFSGFVSVCDQLGGCSKYQTYIQVFGIHRNLLDQNDQLIDSYKNDTFDQELIPILSVAYINTFVMNTYELNYIFNDTLNYLYQQEIDSESLDILLAVVSQIISEKQSNALNDNLISNYLEKIQEFVFSMTTELEYESMVSIFNIMDQVLVYGNFSIGYIEKVHNYLNEIASLYTLNQNPGSESLNLESDFYYYKSRFISGNYSNFTVEFNNSVGLYIKSLPFDLDSIVNLIISIYPQFSDFSSLIRVEFTNSGIYSNSTLNLTSENSLNLNTSTVQINIPFVYNGSKIFECMNYENKKWLTGNCVINNVTNTSVTMTISKASLFQLVLSEPSNILSFSRYVPLIISIIILGTVLFSALIIFFFKQNINSDDGLKNEKEKSRSIYDEVSVNHFKELLQAIKKWHVLLGFNTQEKKLNKLKRILTYALILNVNLMIEGLFFVRFFKGQDKFSRNILIGLLSSVCSIPIAFLSNYSNKLNKNLIVLLVFLYSNSLVVSFLIIIYTIASENLSENYNNWAISFGWGLLFETVFEIISALVFYFIFNSKFQELIESEGEKNKKNLENTDLNNSSIIFKYPNLYDNEKKIKQINMNTPEILIN